MPFTIGSLPRPKVDKQLQVVLTKEEVIKILDAFNNLKYKTLLILTYSAGLRIGEVVRLIISNIYIERKLI
jgi:integrase